MTQPTEVPPNYKDLVYRFIGSLTLCEHMGDVSNEVDTVLKELNDGVEWSDLDDLAHIWGERGITTLGHISLKNED